MREGRMRQGMRRERRQRGDTEARVRKRGINEG